MIDEMDDDPRTAAYWQMTPPEEVDDAFSSPRPNGRVIAILVGVVVALIGYGLLWWAVAGTKDNANENEDLITELATQLAITQSQVEALGGEPVTSVPDEVDDQVVIVEGEPGPQGDRGPQGEPGLDGKDGAAGIPGNQGPAGESGVNGVDGEDGAPCDPEDPDCRGPQGEQGEPCDPAENPACQGPQGEPGTPGADGRGVNSVTFEQGMGSCTMTIVYSDNTSQTFAWPGAICPVEQP